MSVLKDFFITDWGVIVSIVVGVVLLVGVPLGVLVNQHSIELKTAEQKVIDMDCKQLKQYVIDDLQDSKSMRKFVGKAKDLYQWKCEK